MAKGFKHGSGGSNPLNFKVICNPQPSSAKENTIWVDTDKINNYYFSATQPENMVDYDVWITTGTSSTVEFNALKKNGIQVYPLSAKQYVSGAWVEKTAKSWQGGEWVEWSTYIFKSGEGEKIALKTYKQTNANIVIGTDCIQISATGTENNWSYIQTKAPIDLSEVTTIYAHILISDASDHEKMAMGVSTAPGSTSIISSVSASSVGDSILRLDVSALSVKNVYIIIQSQNNAKIYDWWWV